MERKMSWTRTPSHLIKQMSRKRGPKHIGLEGTKWNDDFFVPRFRKVNVIWFFLDVSFCFFGMCKSSIWLLQGGHIRICMCDYVCICVYHAETLQTWYVSCTNCIGCTIPYII